MPADGKRAGTSGFFQRGGRNVPPSCSPVLLAKVINDLQLELIHWRLAQTGIIENSLVRHQVWCAVLSFFQPKRDRFTRLSSLE